MQVVVKLLLLNVLIIIGYMDNCHCKKSDQSSGNENESAKRKAEDKLSPVIDKLAVNLAGAFVKSIFPEIERSTKSPETSDSGSSAPVNIPEIRRSPAGVFDLTSSGQNGLYSSLQNPFPNIGAVPGISSYSAGAVPYRTDLPASYIYPFAQPGQTVTLPNGGQPFGLGRETLSNFSPQSSLSIQPIIPVPENIDAINQYRKEQYLAELQHHQHELNQYTAKQMEYLDQQRKYQQSMLDHQAGAALLMQEQQQNLLNKRMKLMSHGELPEEFQTVPEDEFGGGAGVLDQQTGGAVLQNAKNKNPFKQFASRTQLEAAFPEKNNQEPIATDEYLRKFFKENYNIDINKNMDGEQLTADERNTLRELREHLISEAKGDGMKVGALETLRKYKNKLKQRISKSEMEKLENLSIRNGQESERSEACDICKPVHLQYLVGSWTQVYGNPVALKRIYSTVLSLQSINLKSDLVTTNLTLKKASCVGFQVKKPKRKSAKIHLYFRDDTKRHELFEMNGLITNQTDNVLRMELTNLNTAFCLIKAGPKDQYKYEYIVLAETDGSDRCRSYHIFTRDINRFKNYYYDVIAEFMKREVVDMNILPVAGLPKPQYCQLDFRV